MFKFPIINHFKQKNYQDKIHHPYLSPTVTKKRYMDACITAYLKLHSLENCKNECSIHGGPKMLFRDYLKQTLFCC